MFFVNGSSFSAPESKCKSEIHDQLSIANSCHQHQEKVSRVASTTDPSQNTNYDHDMQDLPFHALRVLDAIADKNLESSLCGTKLEGGVHKTTTGRKEVKSESTAELEHSSSANMEHQATDEGPIEFTSLQAITCESLKGCKTEEELDEVNASTGVFDELFQNYVNTLNVVTKMNNLKGTEKELSFLFH